MGVDKKSIPIFMSKTKEQADIIIGKVLSKLDAPTTKPKNNFRFWFPIDKIEKSTDENGKEVMILGGIASTSREDTDKEQLLPKGFELSYLNERGIVNWNHSKDPDHIIGEPIKTELRPNGLYVETMLYPDSKMAKKVYGLAEILKSNSSKRKLGYSIEGKALERDLLNPLIVKRAMVTNLALTISPKNADSLVDIIKGEYHGWSDDEVSPSSSVDFEAANGGQQYIIDITKPDGTHVQVDKQYNIFIKSLTTVTGAPLIKEHVDGEEKVICHKSTDDELNKGLSSTQVISKILSVNSVISFEKAHEIYQTLNTLTMENNTVITDDLLEKALAKLDAPAAKPTTVIEKAETGEPAATLPVATPVVNEAAKPVVDSISKAEFTAFANEMRDMIGAIATVAKASYNIAKSNSDELNTVLDEPAVGRKTVTTVVKERQFEKGINGNDMSEQAPVVRAISVSRQKSAVVEMLDQMAFKGGNMNDHFAKALTTFEGSGQITNDIVKSVQDEFKVTLVQ